MDTGTSTDTDTGTAIDRHKHTDTSTDRYRLSLLNAKLFVNNDVTHYQIDLHEEPISSQKMCEM